MKKHLGVGLLTISAALVSACSGSDELKGKFLSDCITAGGSKAMCNCAYDRVTKHFSDREQLRRIVYAQTNNDLRPDEFNFLFKTGIDCRLENQ